MAKKTPPEKKKEEVKPKPIEINTIIIALIGLVGTLATAYFGYLSTRPEEPLVIPTAIPTATFTQLVPTIAPTPTLNIRENTITVKANIPWQNSDIQIEKGDQISIKYIEGTWNVSPKNRFTDGSGYKDNIYSSIVENAKYASLIAKIGTENAFQVGNEIIFSATDSGYLFFQINDGILEDNEGEIIIQVVITK